MKPTPELITLAEYRRLARRSARPSLPRAPRDEPTGLTALLRAGWSVESPDCVRYRLTKPGVGDTGLQATLKAACAAAKAMERQAA